MTARRIYATVFRVRRTSSEDFARYITIGKRVTAILAKYEMVSPWDYAKQRGINPTTAVHAVREGRVPGGVRIGHRWLVPRGAFDAAIKGGTLLSKLGQNRRSQFIGHCVVCGRTTYGASAAKAFRHNDGDTVCSGSGQPLVNPTPLQAS